MALNADSLADRFAVIFMHFTLDLKASMQQLTLLCFVIEWELRSSCHGHLSGSD